jgi:hypothetical protein
MYPHLLNVCDENDRLLVAGHCKRTGASLLMLMKWEVELGVAFL